MKFRILLVLSLALIFVSVWPLTVQPVKAASIVTTASSVGVAFWTQVVNPHYGASFSGRNGRAQVYVGPNGPSNYHTYNWWGSSSNVLLLEKRWYLVTSGSSTPTNHTATVDCPC